MHMTTKALVLLLAACRFAANAGNAAWAEEAKAPAAARPSITLAWVEKSVRENNPAIRAALASAAAARGAALASAAWPAPGLGVTYEDFPRPGFSPGDSGRKSFDISQEIPFPGKTFLAHRTASEEAGKAEAEARRVITEQIFMARQAWWDLVVAAQSTRILGRATDALVKITELSAKRIKFGQVGRMEQLMDPMARMEQASLKAMSLDLRLERRAAEAQLNALMGADPESELGAPAEPALPEYAEAGSTAWLDGGLDGSPLVAVALRDLRKMQAMRDQARAGWLPDFMLQYSAAEMKDGSRTGMAMAKVSVPLVWFWRPLGENRAASEETKGSEAMLEQSRLEVRRMAAEEFARVAVVREQLDIFNAEILPQADRALELAVSGYQSGSIGPADVLTAIRSYISMSIEHLMLAAQAVRSAAVLAKLRGD